MYKQWMDLLFPKPKAVEPVIVDNTPPPTYTVALYNNGSMWEVLENGKPFPSALHSTKEQAEFVAAILNERRHYSVTRRRRRYRY